jgi:hypothetical protein
MCIVLVSKNTCTYCGSSNIEINDTDTDKVIETCHDCEKEYEYYRIRIGKKGKTAYIGALGYELFLKNRQKVMVSAAGKRRLILLNVVHSMDEDSVEIVSMKQQTTELAALELDVILAKRVKN